jgi:CubicO group peptidase (beta-lactamase class C family)
VLAALDGPIEETGPAGRPLTVRGLLTFRLRFGARLTTQYQDGLAETDIVAKDSWTTPPQNPSAGGGLVSTIDDFHAFGQMLLAKGAGILSRKTVELMTTDQVTPAQKAVSGFFPGYFDNRGWGFGVAVDTQRVDLQSVGRFGWDGGTGASWWSDPAEDLTGILFTQRMAFTKPLSTTLFPCSARSRSTWSIQASARCAGGLGHVRGNRHIAAEHPDAQLEPRPRRDQRLCSRMACT